jgi:hypothetical protein
MVEHGGLGLREFSRRTGISLGTLSRTLNGERELSVGDRNLIAVAFGGGVREVSRTGSGKVHVPRAGRRAYVCGMCVPPNRVFLVPGDPEPVCRHHGAMLRQENRPYFGQPIPA